VVPSDLLAIQRLIAASVRDSVAESEEDALFLIGDIQEGLDAWASDPRDMLHMKCERDGALVGVVLVKKFWNLSILFVAPEQQRRGVATELMNAVLAECRDRSPRGKLMVNSSTVGVSFYKALGFRQTGPGLERPGGCVPLEYLFES
jgi:GNAT superfamily N-acetyltransferase